MDYFSDRTKGPAARTHEELTEAAWGGIVGLVLRRIDSGALGAEFPEQCPDGNGPYGTDRYSLGLSVRAEIPALEWPLDADSRPDTAAPFDLVEFVFRNIAEPEELDFHSFFRHYHLAFDRESGQAGWVADVNRVLRRTGIAYELGGDGRVVRVLPQAVSDQVQNAEFDTGDRILDQLLDEARAKFVDRDPLSRRDAVEKLWDAFERAKSLRDPSNKKASADQLLDKASSTQEFRALLTDEAATLTRLGNGFRIRHSELGKVELDAHELDYVFARMFALLWHLLREPAA